MPDPATDTLRKATVAGLPAWLTYSLLTIVAWGAWGAVSKVVSNSIDTYTNQVFFTVGLLPLIALVLRSRRLAGGKNRRSGISWAFLTGILGGTGNIAFFYALEIGGKASIVVPATALFPLVTVILAATVLHEKISNTQKIGLALAMVAIYLLSI
ncbi:MAG: EamA family transporter [Acidobacteriaceae bacterium]